MHIFLFLVLLGFVTITVVGSCKNDPYANLKFCTQYRIDSSIQKQEGLEAVVLRDYLWAHSVESHLVIKVRFLNGTEFQQNKVKEYVQYWKNVSAKGSDGSSKIVFSFLPPNSSNETNADVKILFRPGGSSSYIGSYARQIPQNQPSMFLGWINESETEEAIRSVILHEFGHVLGLVHEHQSPGAMIPWDSARVYEYYAITQNPPWDSVDVQENIFAHYRASETNYTNYDTLSIMHYAIPRYLTTNGFSTPWNTQLSSIDTAFLKTMYPFRPCIVNETCCYDRRGRRVLCP